ncbi:MAG: methionine--tRNA ligase [Chloroflexi bacterium]|nr:methionine--tRNA ligase [Chloroflexota bacterium]MCI0830402.1 methionine--tRNA ligase [Chloroflexota bacterium]MCI0896751.1 methionine--tRNA ligase [Chloroflexota bacterium]MCI0899882.1 methionine--tRNA ligase [Chloroflexota bacterium]
MPERIFIAVAWPYANGPLHLGHIAGCYLSADIFARYHRMKGNDVLMVSGSDTHGTPITIRADQEGITPQEVVERYHAMFLEAWQKLGITFDLFTTTNTANHEKVVHDVFKTLHDKGYIYTADMLLAYCAQCVRYLPDRYVEGTCPYCQNPRARGDQCDSCGRTLDPQELVEPRCAICGATPEFRESEHFFLKLSAFEKPLLEWVEKQTHWRPNVLNFTRRFLQDGLKDRSISRDLTWGVPLPMDGYDSKRIYVWFEAVIGYLSAAVEWAEMNGKPDAWEDFWKDPATKSYYFIGKDNIPFHSIIWPAIILAYDKGLNLPYDVPANEFLSLENQKFSTSQNWAVWLPDYLERYDPDPLRYLLSINMPESGDSDFSWAEFVRRNNDELVATYGNLVNRVLSFTYRNFDGKVPGVPSLDEVDEGLLRAARETMDSVDDSLYNCRFKAAITRAFGLAQEANRYLDTKAPWKTIKEDRDQAGASLTVAMQAINCLKTILYPFMPFSSQKVHEFLGLDGPVEEGAWDFDSIVGQIKAGADLREPAPLYTKLDPEIIEEEIRKLGTGTSVK